MGWDPDLGRPRPDVRRGLVREPRPDPSIANQQEFDGTPFGDTLALVPYEAIGCSLDQSNAEARRRRHPAAR